MNSNSVDVDKKGLLLSLQAAASEFAEQLSEFTGSSINKVPFQGSWTAAQVAEHVTRSNQSIARALALEGSPGNREPDARVEELREIFLDFATKFQAPAFILPTREVYEKNEVVTDFENSASYIREIADDMDLSAMINHPAFGDITKMEILYFVLYHTQRHAHQLAKIAGILGHRDTTSPSRS